MIKRIMLEAKYNYNAFHILPIGSVNLTNGNNKNFNVIENSENGGGTGILILVSRRGFEWGDDNGLKETFTYKGIIGSGYLYDITIGDFQPLQHDQTLSDMGNWKIEGQYKLTIEGLKPVINKIGKNSLVCAVLK